jgi:hypothetical protein
MKVLRCYLILSLKRSFTILLPPQFTALKTPLQVILFYNFQNLMIKEDRDGNKKAAAIQFCREISLSPLQQGYASPILYPI